MLCPAALRPGDRVRVIAPSGPFDRTLFWRGVGFLAERYRVEFDRALFERSGFLAGSDARRLEELERALGDAELRAVISARGGYGLSRIIDRVDLSALIAAPKWVVGFSDLTVLHCELARFGVASLHAHNACGLGRGDAAGRARFVEALEAPRQRRRYAELDTWRPGTAMGPLFGGNLTILFTLAAQGRLAVPDDAVLVIEDVTESSYRLDRMLTALGASGAFDRVSAIVVGELTDCAAGPHRVEPMTAVRERLMRLNLPLLAGLPFGHGKNNQPLLLGMPARVEPGALTICPDG